MRTADASSALSAQQVGTSLLIFVIVYFLVFGTGVYYMLKLMGKGPSLIDPHADAMSGQEPEDAGGQAGRGGAKLDHRPLSRPSDAIDD